jgi:hypothetical protein
MGEITRYLVVAGSLKEFDYHLKKQIMDGPISKEDAPKYKYVNDDFQIMGHSPLSTEILFWGRAWLNPAIEIATNIKQVWDIDKETNHDITREQ